MFINIDTGALNAAASQVEGVAEEVLSRGNSIASLGGSVSGAWQSQYTPHFNESFAIVQRKLNTVSEKLYGIAGQLRNTATEIERVEKENAARFGGGSC